jgi:hypothetical protein
LRIIQEDEFTGEVIDSYGNWHDSWLEFEDAKMDLVDQLYDQQKDGELDANRN